MRHAVVSILTSLVRGLDVLDCLVQLLVEILYGGVESIFIRHPENHLQTVVGGRDRDHFTVRLCRPAFRQFELNASFFVSENFLVDRRAKFRYGFCRSDARERRGRQNQAKANE